MEKLLAEVFGHGSFRPGQRESIQASMEGRDVLLVLPTGGGKSLCYQLPALSRFREGRGPTLVISPLIALMEDQVEAARSKGIPIETVHSGMHWSDQKEALERARSSALLLVSPERVVVDVDADFQLSDEWYENVARSRPPRDEPWYHVLVDGAQHTTYVAEQNLDADETGLPIDHPLIDHLFASFRSGRYERDLRVN